MRREKANTICRQNGYGLLRCYIMLSRRQTPSFWRNPLPPYGKRTELTEEKQRVIRERQTYRTGATLPFFILFFPHSSLLVTLLSNPMKNKRFRLLIQMTCS
jgi:hypothetical protein